MVATHGRRRGVSNIGPVPSGEIALYEAPDGQVRLDVRLERETIWLSQKQMAEFFDTSTDNVGLHLKKVYAEGELGAEATTEDYSVVQSEGARQVRRQLEHVSAVIDAIAECDRQVAALADAKTLRFATSAGRRNRDQVGRHLVLTAKLP